MNGRSASEFISSAVYSLLLAVLIIPSCKFAQVYINRSNPTILGRATFNGNGGADISVIVQNDPPAGTHIRYARVWAKPFSDASEIPSGFPSDEELILIDPSQLSQPCSASIYLGRKIEFWVIVEVDLTNDGSGPDPAPTRAQTTYSFSTTGAGYTPIP